MPLPRIPVPDIAWPCPAGIKHVWVSGRAVRVRRVKAMMTTVRGAEVESDALGEYKHWTDVITIAGGLSGEVWWRTLQHEMTHALCYSGPMRTMVAKIEEPLADAIAESRMATARKIAELGRPDLLELYLTHM